MDGDTSRRGHATLAGPPVLDETRAGRGALSSAPGPEPWPHAAAGNRHVSGKTATKAALMAAAAEPGGGLALEDLECPVCLSALQDPFVTMCGHVFCHRCISTHLAHQRNCPSCSTYLTHDSVFPNFLLQRIAKRAGNAPLHRRPTAAQVMQGVISEGTSGSGDGSGGLGLLEVNNLLSMLWERKTSLEQRAAEANLELLMHFLQDSRKDKAQKLEQLQLELLALEDDITAVAGRTEALNPAFGGDGGGGSGMLRECTSSELRLAGVFEETVEIPASPIAEAEGAYLEGAIGTVNDVGSLAGSLIGTSVPIGGPFQISGSTAGEAQRTHSGSATAPILDLQISGLLRSSEAAAASLGVGTLTSAGSAGAAAQGAAGSHQGTRVKKKRVVSQFEDLQQCYLRLRGQQHPGPPAAQPPAAHHLSLPPNSAPDAHQQQPKQHEEQQQLDVRMPKRQRGGPVVGLTGEAGLEVVAQGSPLQYAADSVSPGLTEFSRILSVFTHCSRLRVLAQLPPASTRQSSAILSSIEFDRDSEFFATAGVSKRISIFDFADVLSKPYVGVHSPALEINTRSKLSCVAWHKYVKSHLISSDYEGVLALWDVNTSQSVREYEAHEKRIWSVDFCHCDPMRFVSGSDDGWVKVWSTNSQSSVAAIDMKANVCCVKHSPSSPHQLAIGSADHNVHLYDLRKPNQALRVFSGHRKAVAYVRYLSEREVVSASTDSTLRLWSVDQQPAVRVYEGHVNEKNFVGLSAEGEFIACGSELNEVYIYYKMMSKSVAKRVFSALPADPVGTASASGPHDSNQFISAICWKPGTNTLLAANSQGTIKVMQLAS